MPSQVSCPKQLQPRARLVAWWLGICVLIAGSLPLAGIAAARDAERGRVFVERNCASCHAVGVTGASRNPKAPPLRVISRRYKPADLEEAFAEGIVAGHPVMPEFELKPQQIDDLVAWLTRLRRARAN
jgi:cytochrome c